jgi:hypothetical protein
MPLPGARLTVGRMMVLLALMALAFAFGLGLYRRFVTPWAERFRRTAASHARIAGGWKDAVKSDDPRYVQVSGFDQGRPFAEDHDVIDLGTDVRSGFGSTWMGVSKKGRFWPENPPGLSDTHRRLRKEEMVARAAYHEALRRKYEDAAEYPWLPVAPDPPPPQP